MDSYRFSLTLHHVATASYTSLAVVNQVYPCWVLSHVLHGQVETETRGLRNRANAGDVMVHPPNIPFSEHADTAGTHQWMAFEARIGDIPHRDLLADYPLPPVITLAPDGRQAYTQIFEKLRARHEEARAEPIDELQQMETIARLLRLLIDSWRESGAPIRPAELLIPQGRFAELLAFMSANLHRSISRDELARIACLHPGSLDRAFRVAHGVAPMQMLRSLRLERARRLLETTDRTLESIAASVGLGDAPRFSRAFRAQYGVSPGAYRMSATKAKESYIPPLS